MSMVKVKLADIVGAENAIRAFLPERPSPKFSYRIQKNLRVLQAEIVEFQRAKDAIIRELGSYRPDAAQWSVSKDDPVKWDAFIEKMDDLLKTEIELDLLKFKITEVELEGIRPPIDAFAGLWFMFEED